MITDEDVEKAVDYLRLNARVAAQSKANRVYLEEYRKVIKSQIMRENNNLPLGAQEAIAYCDARYDTHLKVMRDAIENDEYRRWMMTASQAKIAAWQTQSANNRILDGVR